ncbi:MAG: hypothetical protein ACRELY_23650, partial [Polyangiaceae bacterium]
MAEYAYLVAAPEPRKRGELRFLLSGKRNHPFAWLLAMAGSACADDDANVLASPTAAAIDRAKKRFARLHPLSGPRLRATFDGFLKYLESVREPFLLLDATDLDGFEEDDLDSAIALDDAAFDPSELDLDPWEAGADEDDDDDAGDWRFELSGGGRDATYLMFGSVEEGDSAWLRPPEKNDTDRASAVLAAMAGYTRMAGPTTVRTGTSFTFSHPVHRGAVFRVVLTDDDEYALSIHPSEDNASDLHDHRALSLGSFPETPRLAAWAAHVAAHFSLLTFPTEDDWIHGRRYWLTPGGLEFGLRMPTYAPDADDLRSRVVDRLCAAISDFVMSDAPWISLDLGPLGSLILEHVNDPG